MPDYVNNGTPWYSHRDDITRVEIRAGVTTVGNYAFQDCSELTAVEIADSVTSIGNHAFDQCAKLTGVALPDGVIFIGGYAFRGCAKLASASLGSSVVVMGSYAFDSCTALQSITLPDSLTDLGFYAFQGCTSLETAVVGSGITELPENVFGGCIRLSSVTVPETLSVIGANAFANCMSLEEIRLPVALTEIGAYAFAGCSNLTVYYAGSENMWDAYVTVDPDAGIDPERLVFTGLPAGPIGDLFWTLTADGELIISGEGVMPSFSPGGAPWAAYAGQILKVTLEEGVTEMGNYGLTGCSALTEICLPDSLQVINGSCFAGCTALERSM